MQTGSVVASVEQPQYRAVSEHDDVESEICAVLRCCGDVGSVQFADSRVASSTRISSRMPRFLDGSLCD
jgi:hypothetical protein